MNDSTKKDIRFSIFLFVAAFIGVTVWMHISQQNQSENTGCTIESFNVNVKRQGVDSEYVFTCREHPGKSFVFTNPKLVIEKDKKYSLRVDKRKSDPVNVLEMAYAD